MPKNRYERRIDEQRAGTSGGGGFSVSGGSGGTSDHGSLSGLTDDDHTQYHNNTRGDARYPQLTDYNSHVADADAHHNQVHAITGADHTVVGSKWDIVGLSADNTLGLLDSSNDGSAGDLILRTGASGNVTVNNINAVNAILSGDIDAATGTITTLDGTTLTYVTLNGTTGNITNINSAITKATTRVDTPLITSLSGTTGGSLQLDGDTEIILGTTMKADTDIDGAPSLQLNPNIGLGDFEIIQAKEAYFEALIAQVKWAEAGAIIISKSVGEVAEEFTIPAHVTGTTKPTATELIVNEFESLPGFSPIGGGRDDHIVRLHYLEASGTVIEPVGFIGERMQYGAGSAGSATVYTLLNFEAQTVGDPSPVMDFSGANNSTTIASDSTPATVELDGSNKALFYDGGAVNAHLHYRGAAQASIEAETGIVYTGRFKRSSTAEGIGLLVADRYPTDSTDEYVRIRCYGATGGNSTMHVNDHGQTVTPTGTTDSGYNPSANSWHRFRIEFDDGETTASTTTLKARFWADGSTEPGTWQIECEYTGAGRPTAGTVGIWLYNNAGVWYDDLQIESLSGTAATDAEAAISIPNDVGNNDWLIAVLLTESTTATITKPTDFTLVTSGTFDTTFKYYVYRHQWQTGDDTLYTWSSDETEEIYVALYAFSDVNGTPTINVATTTADDTPNPSTSFTATPGDMDAVVHLRTDSAIITGLSVPTAYTDGDYATDFNSYSSRIVYRSISSDGSYLPSFFADEGDYIILHIALDAAAATGTDFAIGYVHGVVEEDTDQTGLEDGQVRYKWWTLPNQSTDHGRTVPPGAVALDFGTGALSGKSADSFIELTTLDKTGAPYIRFAKMVTYSNTTQWWKNTAWNPNTASLNTTRVMQMGELKGLSGFDSDGELGLTIDSADGRRQNFTDQKVELDGPDITFESSGVEYMTLSRSQGIEIVENQGSLINQRGYSFTAYDGSGEAGGMYMYGGSSSRQMYIGTDLDRNDELLNVVTLESHSGLSTTYGNFLYLRASQGPTLSGLQAEIQLSAWDGQGSETSIGLTASGVEIDSDTLNTWTNLTLAAGYTATDTVRYKKIGDLVLLTGRVTKDNNSWSNTGTVLTLPAAITPTTGQYFRLRLGTTHINVSIGSGGALKTEESTTNSNALSFAGVVYTLD